LVPGGSLFLAIAQQYFNLAKEPSSPSLSASYQRTADENRVRAQGELRVLEVKARQLPIAPGHSAPTRNRTQRVVPSVFRSARGSIVRRKNTAERSQPRLCWDSDGVVHEHSVRKALADDRSGRTQILSRVRLVR
jgi:hypothetical protein